MSCIQCGNLSTVLPGYCINCINMASSYSAALPNPMISSQPTAMPPPPSDPATEMRVKRDEAINRARELYGHPAPAPTPTLQPIYPSSQVISATSLSAPNPIFPGHYPTALPPGAPGIFPTFFLCFKYVLTMSRN